MTQHGSDRPILVFDTSALNRLADDPESGSLVSQIGSRLHVRLGFTLLSEIAATPDEDRRHSLLGLCSRLMAAEGGGDCLGPVDKIMQQHVRAFEGRSPYNWCSVDVRLPEEMERYVRSGASLDDATFQRVLQENKSAEKKFSQNFDSAQAEFDAWKQRGAEWPTSAAEFVRLFEQNGPAFWKVAASLYGADGGGGADQDQVRRVYESCTPFRAMLAAIWVAIFDRCVRRESASPSFRAGCIDTFTAVYLPYGDVFVTDDQRQLRCFREVSSVANLSVQISSYEEFRRQLCGASGPA